MLNGSEKLASILLEVSGKEVLLEPAAGRSIFGFVPSVDRAVD
jgi:hypothetical protein